MSTAIAKDLRTRRFWGRFAVSVFAAVGVFSAVLTLFDVLFPDVLPSETASLVALVVIGSLTYGAYRAWPRPIRQAFSSPNIEVHVIEGDLFDQHGHLVIGMCDTFDTSIPDIIARQSVQGQFLDRVFDGSVAELDSRLSAALVDVNPIQAVEKEGKTQKYPLGTVATLKEHSRCYFCVAYTEMNEKNEARGTVDGVWRSLDSLWKAISAHGNGGRVSAAVIGGGQSRLAQILPAQDSIRLMALSFVLASRREKICDELVIVVQQGAFENLDRLEISAFLESLRPS